MTRPAFSDSPADTRRTDADGDRYLRLSELAQYNSLSVRTLQRLIASKDDPLPAHHVGRLVIVRKREFDAWLARREQAASQVQGSLFDVSDDDWRIAMALRGYAVKGGR